MKNCYHIEDEVDKTLGMLDELERVEGNPFLFTRIQEQIQQEEMNAAQSPTWLGSAKWAMVACLLAVNSFAIYQAWSSAPSHHSSMSEILAKEYSFQPLSNHLDFTD